MKYLAAQFVLIAALAAAVLAPEAHADPVPGPLYDSVCQTLDIDPSVLGVRGLMNRDTLLLFSQRNAWDTIVDAMASGCPQHADVLRQYAMFYGGHWASVTR